MIVPAGARQARDKPGPDRIGAVGHDDRNRPSLLLDRRDPLIGGGHDDIHLEAHQLGRDMGDPLGPGFAQSALEDDVLPLHVPVLTHPLLERFEETLGSPRSAYLENPDFRDLRGRLRLGGDRGSGHGDGAGDDQPERSADHPVSCPRAGLQL